MPPARRNTTKDSLAGAAGDRVRAIIEAAESSAAEIRAEAEAEAERVRAAARERASALRSEVRGDVQALVHSMRDAVGRLRSDLERLQERIGEEEPEMAPPAVRAPDPDVALAEAAAGRLDEPEAIADSASEGARLVALNMVLDGASREDIEQHLRDSFGVSNPGPLLDEVFASVGR